MSRLAPTTGRRGFLSAVAAGVCGVAGCGGQADTGPVSLLVAGSLNNAMEHGYREAVDGPVQVEAMGSARAARLVADGAKEPDIVSLADETLFESVLDPDWHARFATNALVLVYDPESAAGRRLSAVGEDRWYEVLLDDDVSVGRTDPDLDPLGYRTLFLLTLASRHYDTERDLRDAVPVPGQIYPETQLLSQFETGGVDAAVAYRNMAVERGYDYVELPAAIDLSDPAYDDRYGVASYELPDGTTVSGRAIAYVSTLRADLGPVDSAYETHISGGYLGNYGLTVPDSYPTWGGDAPERFAG